MDAAGEDGRGSPATTSVTRPDGVVLGLSAEVTYGPDPACEAATRVAVAVADAWGIPH